jgi:hypothetical protein
MSGHETPMSGWKRRAKVTHALARALACVGFPAAAAAQTEYYNLDSNRPLRVEDALPTQRRSLDLQLAPLRLDVVPGAQRWRLDPKISYGVSSFTEIELRVPVLFVRPRDVNVPTSIGLTSIGVGALRALNTETAHAPAVALAGELLIPAGSLAPPNASYSVKGLATKTLAHERVTVNASYGTYSVRTSSTASPAQLATCRLQPPGAPGCAGVTTIPDLPCSRAPATSQFINAAFGTDFAPSAVTSTSASCLTADAAAAPAVPRATNVRWFAGIAVDHSFALASTLLGADIFAERFVGLTNLVDWTGEIGLRHQWAPKVVLDLGVARHFAGVLQSTSFTFGATYAWAAAH